LITENLLNEKITSIEAEIRKGETAIVQYQQALQSSIAQVTELRGAVKAYQELLGEIENATGNPSHD
jgi:chromosome segregation ATPase